jgi:20S proteasome alpha/beta subunit
MTTILAFRYRHGVMCAADRQTTSGFFYDDASSVESEKICQVAPHAVLLGSGYCSSIQFVEEFLREGNQSWFESSGFYLTPEGQVRSLCHWWRDMELQFWDSILIQGIFVGVDPGKGIDIYELADASFELVANYKTAGSGGGKARDVLDMKHNPLHGARAALDLAVEALFHAGKRDNFTSDIRVAIPRVATVDTKRGVRFLSDSTVVESVARILSRKSGSHTIVARALLGSLEGR